MSGVPTVLSSDGKRSLACTPKIFRSRDTRNEFCASQRKEYSPPPPFVVIGFNHPSTIHIKYVGIVAVLLSSQSYPRTPAIGCISTMKVFSTDHTFDYSWSEVSTANWLKYSPWNKSTNHVIAVDTLSRRIDPSTGILRTERLITCQQQVPGWVLTLLGSTTSHVLETSYVDPKAQRVIMCSTNLSFRSVLSVLETVTYEPDNTGISQPSTTSSSSSPPSLAEPSSTFSSIIQQMQRTDHDRIAPPSNPPDNASKPSAPSPPTISTASSILQQLHLIPTSPNPHPRTRFTQEARITALCGGWKKIREKVEEATIERFAENAKRGREGFESVLEATRGSVLSDEEDDDVDGKEVESDRKRRLLGA